LRRPIGACRTAADLVAAHLARLRQALPADCDSVVAAVPSYWTTQQLGLLLGMARDIGLPLLGFADQAVASARRPYPGRDLWNFNLTLHDAELVRLVQGEEAQRGDGQRFDWLSAEILDRTCAQSIATAFLQTSRFDPFHDAESEQQLYDGLAGWLRALRARDSVEVSIQHRGNDFTAMVQGAAVREAVAQAMGRLTQKLRAAIAADESAVLQIPDQLADYPGALEALSTVANCEVVALEPAAAAAGSLRLPAAEGTAAVRLTTRLSWDRPPAEPATTAIPAKATAVRPTHLVYRGRAYRLGPAAFELGSEVEESGSGLRLPASVQALSRRHCSLRVENGRVLVHDHSRYGTWLNGQRIEDSAVLHAGDTLQIGRPAIELMLVAEVPNDATTA
jgi:hypothetical protein